MGLNQRNLLKQKHYSIYYIAFKVIFQINLNCCTYNLICNK